MATKKPQGQKAESVADAPEIIRISWVPTQYTKFAGPQTLREYRDPINGKMHTLVNPNMNQPSPFTISGGKNVKLDLSNDWHRAVYDFIIGDTKLVNGEVVGRWRGHPRMNPAKKIFSLENQSIAAKKKNVSRKEVRTLLTAVEQMSPQRLLSFGLLFGIRGVDKSYDTVLNDISEIIETPVHTMDAMFTVADVKKKMEDPDLEAELLVAVLLNEGAIKLSDGVYRYDNQPVGVETGQIVQWLKDNPMLYQTIKAKYLIDDLVTA